MPLRPTPHGSPLPRACAFAPLLTLLLAAACDGSEPGQATAAGAEEAAPVAASRSEAETRGEIRDLIVALTPPAPTVTQGHKHDWFPKRRRTLERLRALDAHFGRAVLEEFHEQADGLPEVRIGLLDVASHCAPDEARPLLVELISGFDSDTLAVRTAACDLLARTSPTAALELLGTILRERKHRVTYPPEEHMLRAWVHAADQEGVEQGAFLADIAVQLDREHATRQAAARALAACEGPAVVEALKALMVESTGNHMLRRTATQSLREVLPNEPFCAHLREVMELESDQAFQLFLADMLEDNC